MQFTLDKIPIFINLGVTELERKSLQKILLTLDFEVDTKKAELSDDINDTVNYSVIYQKITQFIIGKKYNLLEKCYYDIIKFTCQEFKDIKIISLKLDKFPFSSGKITIQNPNLY